jgi:microsomal dipeptidase-like Zn-dependent dipeptidase
VDYLAKLAGVDHVGLGSNLIFNWSIDRHGSLDLRPDAWGRTDPNGKYHCPFGIDNVTGIVNIEVAGQTRLLGQRCEGDFRRELE